MSSTHWPKETDVSRYDRFMQTLNVNALLNRSTVQELWWQEATMQSMAIRPSSQLQIRSTENGVLLATWTSE